jgi:hypothetical protein
MAAEMLSVTCPSCGTVGTREDKFCRECGNSMDPSWQVTRRYIDSTVQDALTTAIEHQFKDKNAVELEITEKIAERAVKWAKVCGYFVGIPLAIFAVILSFFGVKTYSDLQKASDKVFTTTSQLEDAQKNLKIAQESTQKLINATEGVEGEIKKRLKDISMSIDAIESEVKNARIRLEEIPKLKDRQEQLETAIREIEKRVSFEPTPELTPEIQRKLEASLERYLSYLSTIGFSRDPAKVSIKIQKEVPGLAHYRPGQRAIVIDSRVVTDEYVGFREYTHHVLIDDAQRALSIDQLRAIASALADYFPCSFTNNPNAGEEVVKVLKLGQPYIRSLENKRNFGEFTKLRIDRFEYDGAEIWGVAFWEIRGLLGQMPTDTLLFQTWRDIAKQEIVDSGAELFITTLMSKSRQDLKEQQLLDMREILKQRGFPLP